MGFMHKKKAKQNLRDFFPVSEACPYDCGEP